MVSGGFLTGAESRSSGWGADWSSLTPQQKRQRRYDHWLAAEGIKFVSDEARKAYRERAQRLIDAYEVREPDRVPVSVPVGALPIRMAGIDQRTAMYDARKAVEAWAKFNAESGLDTFAVPSISPGQVLEDIDYKLYIWPGHGLPDDADGHQYVEGEYMTVDEYDELITDPSDFWMRKYMPRTIGIMQPWQHLTPMTSVVEIVNINTFLMPFARKDVQESLRKLTAAADRLAEWTDIIGSYARRGAELGYPASRGAFAKAPFDTIGDTLRGTRGVFMDMYRCPDKLLAAMDRIADITIQTVVSTLNASKGFIATFPLHKGADGWMSQKQFETFYWPPLKKIIDAFVKEGILVSLFAEGSYDARLETCNVFPRGSVLWLFDKSDMAHAKKVLGDKCCISGNVPASILRAGTPAEVKEYCRRLIETCGKGGGYILAAGNATVDRAEQMANVRAMVEAANEYGRYR